MNEHSKRVFNRNVISSTHINLFFGAGVNGKAFPQLDKFKVTLSKIEELGGDITKGLENGIDTIVAEDKRIQIKKVFIKEFKSFYNNVLENGSLKDLDSLKNLENLLRKIYSVVHESQNRYPSMKQINIYTLNYDDIVERILSGLGYFYNAISASNIEAKAALMDVIGYDYKTKKYIPSFMVSKLHGDIDKPIIPGKEKYQDMLNEDYFEIAFNMKEQLCKPYSILIVIGYSGRDQHINKILLDCLNTGLTIYWFKYGEEDFIPFSDCPQIIIREQDDYNTLVDTTKICCEDLEYAWVEM